MNRVRKKRGWVYRGALATMIALAVAVGVLWVATYSWPINLTLPLSTSAENDVYINDGRVYIDFMYSRNNPIDVFLEPIRSLRKINPNIKRWWYFSLAPYPSDGGWFCTFPLWASFLVLLIWPVSVTIRWIYRRHPPGCCVSCNYDLRGSKQSTSCPECGEVITQSNMSNTASID